MARTRDGINERGETSLDAAMRAPSTTVPDIIVLGFVEENAKVKDMNDPEKDLWLSTSDGRHQSKIIPIHVGPHAETFSVHLFILRKSEYFRKALDGGFREAEDQAIDLPEEDPDIFSFLVAFLYEEKFVPIEPVARVLVKDVDKGKGKEGEEGEESDVGSDSGGSGSDESARSRRRRDRHRRRQARVFWEQRQRKEPNRHRTECNCSTCIIEAVGPPCWHCGVTRRPPPPRQRPVPWNGMPDHLVRHNHLPGLERNERDGRRLNRANPRNTSLFEDGPQEERMTPEDLRTWGMAYNLSIEVYICAERYLMQDFKSCISSFIINNFEIAGPDAALPLVLQSCKTLYDGVSPLDPLLKKIFARTGFLMGRLWKNHFVETEEFFDEFPKLASLIMREMVERRQGEASDELPPMEGFRTNVGMEETVRVQGGPMRYNRR